MSRGRRRASVPRDGASEGASLVEVAAARHPLLGPALIVLAAALVYSNTLDASFHFDDVTSIAGNPAIRSFGSFWPPSGTRTLGYLSFALNYRLGGLDVLGYHLANLLVHACNGLLVHRLATLALRTPALRGSRPEGLVHRALPLVAGLLFTVHPLATQAVTYVVQRFTSLATLFYLLAVVLYLVARLELRAEGRWSRRAALAYAGSLLAAVAAMKTKEIGVTLPLVALGCELLLFERPRRIGLVGPIFAAALLVPLAVWMKGGGTADLLEDASRLTAETQQISRWDYALTQTRVVARYLRLLVLPAGQNFDHDLRISRSLDPAVLACALLLLAVVALAVVAWLRARKVGDPFGLVWFLGVAWFFVTISVESSFIPIRDVLVEHRTYLPDVGASLALGAALLRGIELLHARSVVAPPAAVVGLVVLALGVTAWVRNGTWHDEVTLWSDVVAKSPGKPRAHDFLGSALFARGASEEAIREYRKVIELAPGTAEAARAHSNIGAVHRARGRVDDAIREYEEAIALQPDLARAHLNLGMAYEAEGRLEDATGEYRAVLRLPGLDLDRAKAHSSLGAILLRQGRAAEAVQEIEAALALASGLEPSTRARELGRFPEFNLAVALDAAGRAEDAAAQYRRFLAEGGERDAELAAQARLRLGQLRVGLSPR
jgi:tetratricopeptide (TPR) repeat protein